MQKTYDVRLELYQTGALAKDLSGRAIQFVTGDENVYSISLRLTSGDADYAIESGTTVTVNIKPTNAISSFNIQPEIVEGESGLLEMSFPGGFEVYGDYTATVYLQNGANSLTWGQKFTFTVVAGVATA